jgi:hypothetical protein
MCRYRLGRALSRSRDVFTPVTSDEVDAVHEF